MSLSIKEQKELMLFKFMLTAAGALIVFSMGMIVFHPGQEKMPPAEKSQWITILTSVVFLFVRSPLGIGDSREPQVSVNSQESTIVAQQVNNEQDSSLRE